MSYNSPIRVKAREKKGETLLESLKKMYELSDEEYEPYSHFFKVYTVSGDTINEYCLNREDFTKDFDGNIIIKKIYEKTPLKNYQLFESYDEAYVHSYENYHSKMIQKYRRELEDLAKETEKYKQILDEKPHLGI